MTYEIWDVFADAPHQGNPLALVRDGGALDAAARQAWAREFALSETVFVREDEDGGTSLAIHTPERELPMAGHPTIGAAFSLDRAGRAPGDRLEVRAHAGTIPVRLDRDADGRLKCAWMDQGRPVRCARVAARERVANALGLVKADLHPSLPIEAWSAGNPFLLVPLRDAGALARAWLRLEALDPSWIDPEHRAVLAFLPPGPDAPARSRMFGEALGVVEDPGTGSAHGPLGAYLVRHARTAAPTEGRPTLLDARQGVEMGRPSRLALRMRRPARDAAPAVPTAGRGAGRGDGRDDGDVAEVAVEVGGHAVRIATGTLLPDAPGP